MVVSTVIVRKNTAAHDGLSASLKRFDASRQSSCQLERLGVR